jgi:hypothetical protein
MKATTVKEALIAAHWILTHYDWCQGVLWKDPLGSMITMKGDIDFGNTKLGACCLAGAVQLVETDYDPLEIVNVISEAIDGELVPAWNDAPKRTKQEVLDLLDKLIAEA